MSEWTDRVQTHPVWLQMEALGPALDQALSVEGIDPPAIEGLERIRAILTFAGKRLAGIEPQLVQQGSLDRLAISFQQAVDNVTTYTTNGDAAHIASANTNADNILGQVSEINYPFVADDWIALRDAGLAYRRTLEQNTEHVHTSFSRITGEASALEGRLAELRTAIDVESAKLAAVGTGFQATYTESESSRTREFSERVQAALAQLATDATGVQQRLTELAAEIVVERGRLTTLATDFQSQFSTAQDSRGREFSDAQTLRQEKFSALMSGYSADRDMAVDQYQANVIELKQKFSDEAQIILDKITEHKSDVEKLVGVIGNLGVTSGYQKVANQAWWTAIIWQGIAVASMICVIVFAFVAFLPLTEGTFSRQNFAGRIVLSIAVGVLAAYAAAQADRQLEIERRNRKLALELEAIGPYLAPLPVEQQVAFRLQIGERTFGRDDVAVRRRGDKSPATIIDVLSKSKEFREFITDIVKAARG